MASRQRKKFCPLVMTSLWLLVAMVNDVCGDNSSFNGGTISFYFLDMGGNGRQTYRVYVTVITGWVLGHGPCGPGCNEGDVDKPTHDRRLHRINSTGDPTIFGNWSTETGVQGPKGGTGSSASSTITIADITDIVNSNIQGRVAAVSTNLQWELEIAHTELEIDPAQKYTDIVLHFSKSRNFDLNDPQSSFQSSQGDVGSGFRLQTKIHPDVRSDTHLPNSSPLVLYQPVYRVLLDNVTEIRLTSTDKDGDLVECRMADNVEVEGIGHIRNVSVTKGCVVTVTAMSSDGFQDSSWGVVALVLEDFTRNPITMGTRSLTAYDAHALSSSILDFMVWVVANMTVPEFVSPTPVSQHVYTVYAGSVLSIPLAAKPDDNTPVSTQVTAFHVISIPQHFLTAPTPHPDPQRLTERVVTSRLEWRTRDRDKGDYIIQVVALDSDGFDSQDRNYKIHVSDLPQEQNNRKDAKPYFPFFPKSGSITCLQHATCSIPVFAMPGTHGHVIDTIQIVSARTDIPMTESGQVEYVQYRGMHVYRSDVHFTTDILGNKSICFVATDNKGLYTEKCTDVSLYPPNPCDGKPCHKAVCVPSGISFTCQCPPTATGRLCDQWLDPCLNSPCENGATCVSRDPLPKPGCKCAAGFGGSHCERDIDDCTPNPCHNGGVCVDEVHGHHCICPHGYSGLDCDQAMANDPCNTTNCHSSSTCVVPQASSTAECKCPLGRKDANCLSANGPTPLIQTPVSFMPPHSVVPTLRPGTQITCNIDHTCKVPVYLSPGSSSVSQPTVVRGITSPDLMTSVTPTKTDSLTGLSSVLTSTLAVTPQRAGNHPACFEIKNNAGAVQEQICYMINTPDPSTVGPSKIVPANKRFTEETPPDGTIINCVTSRPCHILPHTLKPPSGSCEVVVPASEGVLTFGTHGDPSSDTCATDVLLEPTTVPRARVCLAVGSGGDKRCYTVNTIDDTNADPCSKNPCNNKGVCMPDAETTGGHTCVCEVPFSGPDCSQVENCTSIRCENQGVCMTGSSGTPGFKCLCQYGFGPANSNCRHESTACSAKSCNNGGMCTMHISAADCLCPLAWKGNACENNRTQGLPAGPVGDTSKSHAVVPSLGHGTTVHCDVGSVCTLPIYVIGHPGNPPNVITGFTSPEVTAGVTPPKTASTSPPTMMSSLSLAPTRTGHHHVCVDIRDSASSNTKETICYNIYSQDPAQGPTTSAPTDTHQAGERFIGGTPQESSELTCTKGVPCHFVAQTEKLPSGGCAGVRTRSVGVYTFDFDEADSTTCVADVLIDPSNLGGKDACISVGLTGEKRCFPVSTIDPAHDPCSSVHCQNEGVCIPDSSAAQGYICACPVPYGDSACSTKETCASKRCLNQAVCRDQNPNGFRCSCQSGYTGDDCRHVPQVCSGIHCENGAICVEAHGQSNCKCRLGTEGDTCSSDFNADLPVNPGADHTRPHVVVPSFGNGHVIKCRLNVPCQVPVTMTGSNPTVRTRLVSPGLTADLTHPTATGVPADTVTSYLTVTPRQQTGTQHVCVDVGDGSTSDTVCYVVDVDPNTGQTVPPPGGRFSNGTPPTGSTITCRDDTPCHVLAGTEKPTSPGASCPDARSKTVGVYSFHLDQTTCLTDLLIDPSTAGTRVCVQAGVGGEERCYTVNAINSTNDPCVNNADCKNGGQCVPDSTAGYICLCPVTHTGPDCATVLDPCDNLHCEHDGHCVNENSHVACKCPVGKKGLTCQLDDPDVPVNQNTEKTEPHSVLPTPGNGFEIHCDVGHTCPLPVYIHSDSSGPPEVTPGRHTPGITGVMMPPTPTAVLNHTQASTFYVTPYTQGEHHVCVDVKQSNGVDSVCYTVNSQGNAPTTSQPPAGGTFTGVSPPHLARIPCSVHTACHVIVQTVKPQLPGRCDDITTQSSGTYVFKMPADSHVCNTDVLLEPDKLTGNQACVKVGTNGEERCYTIHQVADPNPCFNNPCQHAGQCVLAPSDTNGYHCMCPPFHTGPQCNTDGTDQPVSKNADTQKPHAVVPTPSNGLEIHCDVGSTCTIPVYVAGGGQVMKGPHTSGVQTQTGSPVTASHPPNTVVTPLIVTPSSTGPHHVCADIRDSSSVVDNVCYTVVGRNPTNNPSSHPSNGGSFKDGTPPKGTDIKCRSGVPCQLIVHTNKPPLQPCIPVQTSDEALTTFLPVTSQSDGATCDIVVSIDPAKVSSYGTVCIQAAMALNGLGEKRCYTVTRIDDTDDKCSSHPCQNGGGCVLVPSESAGYRCVCPDGTASQQCPPERTTVAQTNQPSHQETTASQHSDTTTSNNQHSDATTSNNQHTDTTTSNNQHSDTTSNSQPPVTTPFTPGSTNQQCAAEKEAFRKAAQEGRVRCTCISPYTNQTYTVVRPRVSNKRLLRTAGIGSGVSIGAMATVALIVFLARKLKGGLKKAGKTSLGARPTRGFRMEMREPGADW
ncbi:uncharacterized protein LOC143280810 isoform X2 [Babylonia areolata]|uniref:uncharacterized protein LOC143280810 isoform X2 n=1 Tax=Babylonia areolata TaxID=304850 RepID=UPI003FD6006A